MIYRAQREGVAGAMGEISEGSSSSFDAETMRKTKPGLKRLFLTLAVLLSFILGAPFLLKTIEIYRSPLPFSEIDTLFASIQSNPVSFPCNFQAVYVDFDHVTSTSGIAKEIGFSIESQMREFAPSSGVCGACSDNFTVAVTIDSASSCSRSTEMLGSSLWKCGAFEGFKFEKNVDDFDNHVDEYLNAVLGTGEKKVYTVVVVKNDDEKGVRAVVGKYRHAWIVGNFGKEEVEKRIAEIFSKVFVNGGREEWMIPGEFMPVGADGKVVLSFNLLNADPRDWVYDWDLQDIDQTLLAPIINALKVVADVSAESQVLYHTPKSSFSHWDGQRKSQIFSVKDLPFFVNSYEWHLDTSTAAGGRSKILQFVVYVPSARECPLSLQLPDGEISATNGFISPMWGGVVVWKSPSCLQGSDSSRNKISHEEIRTIFETFVGQLRQLFGLKSDSIYFGASGKTFLLASDRGFSQWELDVLSRQHTCFNLIQCGTTLGSLSRLVQSLPRMIITDEIGKQVKFSLEAASLALSNASIGSFDAAAVSSRQARSLAEDAFYHPSMMSVSYYSFEHCFAVYSPFFLPVSLHVLLAVLREWKRYKQESKKYVAWLAKTK